MTFNAQVLGRSKIGRWEGFAHFLLLTRLRCDDATDAQEL